MLLFENCEIELSHPYIRSSSSFSYIDGALEKRNASGCRRRLRLMMSVLGLETVPAGAAATRKKVIIATETERALAFTSRGDISMF
jgi:hypothetical protein